MQRVLIVDDSRTAQVRLKKMLSRYDLTVDIAFSAEEALGYLSYRTPTVIFMDHHMEGMDGFEALKIIKANPNTAMIPVIMYTAQKGDVYIGQARALGALDILSKEVIKASSLERVLQGLKITPKDDAQATSNVAQSTEEKPSTEEVSPTEPPVEEPATIAPRAVAQPPVSQDDTSLEQIRSQVARLFEMHSADVRQQLADNSRFLIRRINSELDKIKNKEATVGDVPLSVVNAEMSAEQRKASVVSGSLLFLIFMALSLLAYQLFSTHQKLTEVETNHAQLVELNNQSQQLISSLTETISQSRARDTDQQPRNTGLMEALSWALDVDMQFGYNETPLDEQQILKVSNLVYRLASTGFSGSVILDIHFGNFCLKADDAGVWQVADNAHPIDECVFLSDMSPEYSASDYLSLPYLNFEQNAVPIKEGVIELNVTTSGLSEPSTEYPTITSGMTAGTWNTIAAKNNRVSVIFNYF